ncbi:MAG: GNAT family N-acetyltransferase [Actinomycetaceae bacterium]|nr:GNAT family N-acetyltransferase [Actinomycetaceae bacterium]
MPPTELPALEWRPLTSNDAEIFSSLLHRIETHDELPYRTSTDEVRDFFRSTMAHSTIGGFVAGELKAYGYVRIKEGAGAIATCQGGVDPDFRGLGIGRALVTWQTDEARRMLADAQLPQRHITFQVEQGHADLENHLIDLGYKWARSFYDLRAPLSADIHDIELGPFLRIEPWEAFEENVILQAANRVAQEQWNASPQTMELWMSGRGAFRPDWSFVAVDNSGDRPTIAGYIMASRYAQDWSVLGWREGTIDMLGVLNDYRDTHLASALVAQTMRTQMDAGMQAVSAGVTSTNHTAAISIYDSLGFTTVSTARLYTLDVD